MPKDVSARTGKQNPQEKNRDSKDAMTKGLQAIAYTAGAVAGLASKTFAGRESRKEEKSPIPPKLQEDRNHTPGKTAGSRSRKVSPTAGSKRK
jgi:hypothetical protein